MGEDALHVWVTILDEIQRQNNFKNRGNPEDVGGNTDLTDLMSQ